MNDSGRMAEKRRKRNKRGEAEYGERHPVSKSLLALLVPFSGHLSSSRPAPICLCLVEPAVFLDRDNTLIANDGDLGDPDKVRILDGVPAGLLALRKAGFRLVV